MDVTNKILEYLKGFLVLFLLVSILVNMVPRESYQKYIRFFSQLLLAFGIFYPVLGLVGDGDTFLKMVQYEAFTEGLAETARDYGKIEYMQNDYYVKKYEDAVELDVAAQAKSCGYGVRSVIVEMTENYEIEKMRLELSEPGEEHIVIGKISIGQDDEAENVEIENTDERYQQLKERLIQYYQLTEEQIDILCE